MTLSTQSLDKYQPRLFVGVMCGPGCLLAEVMVRMSGSLVMELHLATSDSDDDDDDDGVDDDGDGDDDDDGPTLTI